MSEPKPTSGLKLFALIVFAVGMSFVVSGGVSFATWKFAGEDMVDETVLKEVILVDREEVGRENTFEKQQRDTDEWFGSVQNTVDVQAGVKEASAMKAAEKKTIAKRPVVSKWPIEATDSKYREWMARKDVLVLVEYYADW